MSALVMLLWALSGTPPLGTAEPPSPPPLTEGQLVRLRELVHGVQSQATLLQARLDERQRALAEVYTAYELDEERARKLQAEIVELQRSLLANHHTMQVELRAIVARDRFEVLRRRLAYVVAPPAAADRDPPAPPRESSP